MAYLDPQEASEHFQERVLDGIRMHFPMQGRTQSVHLKELEVKEGTNGDDIRSQHQAKIDGGNWTSPVYGHLELRDNETGKVLDSHKIRLAEIPRMTRRYSYIMGGQEYQIDNQWQLKPGVYTRRKDNGELESQFNVTGKPSFKVGFEPETGRFLMDYGKSKIPLYPIMKTMGVDDATLEKSWGKSVLEANKTARGTANAVERFYKADKKTAAPSAEAAKQHLYDTLTAAKLRPESTAITLGKPFENVSGEVLRLATEKILKVQSGHPEDDRDSLVFKDLRTAGDFAYDKLRGAGPTIRQKFGRNIQKAKGLRDVIKLEFFNKPVHEVFHNNAAVRQASQINPVEMVASAGQTTIMGPGGIQSEQAISDAAKFVNPSHLGFLDPINTPEGEKTGITLRLPLGVKKVGNEPKLPLYNMRSGKMELVSPGTVQSSNVVLPDQVEWKNGKPVARGSHVMMNVGGKEIQRGQIKDADYVMRHASQLFNVTSNLIPFLNNTSGNRASMASRHIEQSISLVHREPPLVQVATGVHNKGIDTFETVIGRQSSHITHNGGVVHSVKKDAIVVHGDDGRKEEVQLYNNYPLNDAKSVMHSTSLVKVGDRVRAGQTIADTNFTRGGTLALGTNLRVGYVPFKGYNFEDGIVISESAANKLASEHLQKHALPADTDLVFDPSRFATQHPGVFKREQLAKVGDDGVVKIGTRVKPGDPLVVAMKPFKLKDRTGISAIRRSLAGSHTDKSLRWDSDFEGEVVATHRSGKNITVHVKTVEPMQVGDKMAGRYGNKGIVTMILPDHEMPHTRDGKHIEVALNPSGVPGRMNVGQVLETAAAKIAEKTKKPYLVTNFEPHDDVLQKIRGELKTHGISDTEELMDPATGHSLGHALVGPQHMLKLVHQVDKKMSVRSGMALPGAGAQEHYDLNLQPTSGAGTGGQSMGVLGMYAMLAHGAKSNIREMQTWKSEGPDPQTNPSKQWASQHNQVWSAIQTGHPLPTPQPTFAFQKFTDLLRASGVNIEKKGHQFALSPMTDKHILHMSAGALPNPTERLHAKGRDAEPTPRPGGLFDEKLTGGLGGRKWSHITLAEPMPNPLFEPAICKITGITSKDLHAIVAGEKGVTPNGHITDANAGVAGGAGIKVLLDNIDVKRDLAAAKRDLTKASGAKIDPTLKKVKYLQALDHLGMKASDAYILHHLPVLPPVMRPVSILPTGDIKYADVNGLYAEFAQVNDKLKDPVLSKNLTDVMKRDLRRDSYDGVKAIMGIGVPYADAQQKGLLHQISGSQPKLGYFQDTLMNRRQDLTMRSTIVPEPSLALDEVGLPRHAALDLFRPFVVKKLKELGHAPTAIEAQKLLADKHPSVWKALDKVVEERPVLLKRDPALHKHSVQAFKPKLVHGNAIQIHPLVTGGYNADFDGDSIDLDTPIPLRIKGQVCQRTGRQLEELLSAEDGNYIAFTKNIEAWTYEGWRPVKNISFHEVLEKKKYKITLRNGLSFIASEDHSLMVGRVEVKPGAVTVGTTLDHVPVRYEGRKGASYERGVAYGNFLGDGCAEVRRQGGGRVAIACLPLVERNYLMDIWRSNFPNANPSQYVYGFHVNGIDLARHFLDVCGRYSDGKYVGDELLNKGEEFLAGLLAGHILADGSVELTKSGSYLVRTWSRSKAIQDGMSLTATMLGLPHSRRERTVKGRVNYLLSFGKEAIKLLDYRCPGKKGELLKTARHEYAYNREDDRRSQSARGFEVQAIEEVEYNDRMIDIEVDDPQHVFAIHSGIIVHNTMSVFVPISQEAVAEAHKMMPSNNLFSEATGKVVYQPTLESALGLYKLSVRGKEQAKKYQHEGQVVDAVRKGDIHINDVVHVPSGTTTAGRVLLASALPEKMQKGVLHDLDNHLDRKGLDKLLTVLAKDHAPVFGQAVNRLKDLGNGASFGNVTIPPPIDGGHNMIFHKNRPLAELNKSVVVPMGTHSLSLADFETDKKVRNAVLGVAQKKVDDIRDSTSIPAADKDRRSIQIWSEADREMRVQHEANEKKNPSNLFQMYQAGVKPGWDQYKQMVIAPMLLKDSADRTIPTPVMRSYSEGLDVGGYWTQMHGARRGAVMKVQEVQEPGYMSKLLMNNMMHMLVSNHDCGTARGIAMDVSEGDVHDRHLAEDFKHGHLHIPAGTMLSPDVVGQIRAAKKDARLVVRSPLKCEEAHGLCQKCVGLDATGHHHPVGTNIGVLSAHSVGERAVQLTLKAFHTGGVQEQGGGKLLNSFARFQQLTMLPQKIPNAASLAMTSGRVTKIDKVPTGVNVFVNGRAHFIGKDPSGMPLHENLAHQAKTEGYIPWTPPVVGQHFDAGQHLSDPNRTLVNPHDLYEATGNIEKVQNHMATEIHELYKQEGVKRRTVETVVKAMGNLTRIEDPGSHADILRGEFRPLSVVRKMNAELVKSGKDPIEHKPVLRGLDMLPLSVQEDWMAKLQHQRLKSTILDAAATGAMSSIHGNHPVPGIAYGAEFGVTSAKSKQPGMQHLKDVAEHHY